MAKSDYATLAFNEKCEQTLGVLNGFNGESVEMYKNWLYVNNPKMWNKDYGYTNNTIAQIDSGEINISGFDIICKREEYQGAIFAFIQTNKYDKKDYSKKETKIMAGIGCSGYIDNTHKLIKDLGLTLTEDSIYSHGWSNFNPDVSKEKQNKTGYITFTIAEGDKLTDFYIPKTKSNQNKYDSKWVGVSPKLYKMFIQWLGTIIIDEYDTDIKKWYSNIKKLKMKDVLCFNQGDKFFAEHGVITDGLGQNIGKPKTPFIVDMINNGIVC